MSDSFIPFARPELGEEELQEIKQVLDSGWITTGKKAQEFEARFANFVNAPHAIAVTSCTAALHLALEAIGLDENDEVITSPYTFAASAEVIRYFKAKPVFVDVDSQTLNINVDLIEGAITERTKAVMPIHIAGLPANMSAINRIAKRSHLKVIEDAAHAFPALFKGEMIGSMSDFTCFSFYATKTITTGEGGMICTGNNEWAARCRLMSLHGINSNTWNRYAEDGSWYYEIVAPGFKYNMSDIAAAIGLAQLGKATKMWRRRQEISNRYFEQLGEVEEIQLPETGNDGEHAWHLFMIRLRTQQMSIDRDQFVNELSARGIGSSVHFIPLHLHPYYQSVYGYSSDDFPIAYSEYLREISIPIYSAMTDHDVDRVAKAILDIVTNYRRSS